jgi:esterase/lipase
MNLEPQLEPQSVALTFHNKENIRLSARLELPDQPKAYGIFAHCFTCTKNITATHTISKTLAKHGIAMLRFDFMGLGESEGEFQNTSVSNNISDIESAYHFLAEHFEKPSFLIGHSLGGLASLYALKNLPEIKGCVSINAPSTTRHTAKRVEGDIQKIMKDGFAEIDIVGKKYKIKSHFIEDIKNYFDLNLSFIKQPVMVMHSKEDPIVSINHGIDIFNALSSSKSFITLDNMDHLLRSRDDAEKVAHIIYNWLSLYL